MSTQYNSLLELCITETKDEKLNNVKVVRETIEALEKLITGDQIPSGRSFTPYRSGPDLVDYFNQHGEYDEYGQGFPSRRQYTQHRLTELNGKTVFKDLIENAVDPRNFFGTDFSVEEAVNYINQYLEYDGYKLTLELNKYKLISLDENIIVIEHAILNNNAPNIEFIREQISKCKSKIESSDYDGAITNSRSLLESVLQYIDLQITSDNQKYDGNINQLYKRVQRLLNLDPDRKDISDSLKQLLRGIVTIVSGIASIRNKMSDAHPRSYKPAKHHAELAVNSVSTICTFLLDTFEYQKKNGTIQHTNSIW